MATVAPGDWYEAQSARTIEADRALAKARAVELLAKAVLSSSETRLVAAIASEREKERLKT